MSAFVKRPSVTRLVLSPRLRLRSESEEQWDFSVYGTLSVRRMREQEFMEALARGWGERDSVFLLQEERTGV